MVPGKFLPDEVGATHFVEHVEPVVGCMIKHFMVGIKPGSHLHHMELNIRQACFVEVGEVDLYSLVIFSCPTE